MGMAIMQKKNAKNVFLESALVWKAETIKPISKAAMANNATIAAICFLFFFIIKCQSFLKVWQLIAENEHVKLL